ncbi:MAG: hypothetical protein SPK23_07745 [Eubacteriales bacterium]|nr:hypothetical protein [Eubacteriales bacterium]
MFEKRDVFRGLTPEEIKAKEEKVQEMDFSRQEVWELYRIALKTFLPVVLFILACFGSFYLLFKLWLSAVS